MPSTIRSTPCACTNLRRAARAACHLYDLVLAPVKLKSTQFMLLQVIDESGEVAHCDLARDFTASVETLSRRLAGARKAGLVQVHSGERHKRIYSLTPKGRKVLEEATPYWERAQLRFQQALGDEQWAQLASFAERLATAAVRAETLPTSNGIRRHTAVA